MERKYNLKAIVLLSILCCALIVAVQLYRQKQAAPVSGEGQQTEQITGADEGEEEEAGQ